MITFVEGLPYDCISVLPCATSLGGVLILTSNSIIYIDQAARRVVLPVSGWPARTSDMPLPVQSPEDQLRKLELEGARAAFVGDRTFFIILQDGTVYPVDLVTDGKTVSKLTMAPALAQTTVPTVVKSIGSNLLFVGSTTSRSVLLKTTRVEEEVVDDGETRSTVVDIQRDLDLDDDGL